MEAEQRVRLDAAYRATAYFVNGPSGCFDLRIGQASAEVDALAARHRVVSWTYITAYNPGSVALLREENEKRQQELERAVSEVGYCFYRGEGKGAGDWPEEPSLLVLGVSETDAAALARRFGQAGVLFGERGGPVQLLWTDVGSTRSNREV